MCGRAYRPDRPGGVGQACGRQFLGWHSRRENLAARRGAELNSEAVGANRIRPAVMPASCASRSSQLRCFAFLRWPPCEPQPYSRRSTGLAIKGAWPKSAVAAVGWSAGQGVARAAENALKFAVGAMIVSLGVFSTLADGPSDTGAGADARHDPQRTRRDQNQPMIRGRCAQRRSRARSMSSSTS
jgi:hypothetical protein